MRIGQPIPDETWMRRCFDLASLGLGHVSPNPPVGAVLVHGDRILGEGYHHQYGGPHAEVNAIQSVPAPMRHLIPESTLYVSLEPCCVYGKTPPCTQLIISEGIRDVRISCHDPNPQVSGQGIRLLEDEGIRVTPGLLQAEGRHLIRAFTTNILKKRPHILLKWAQSRWGYAGVRGDTIWLSDPMTRVWTHRQRSQCDAILVGARTIEADNPELTVRESPGRSPQRIVYDPSGRLHPGYRVFSDDGTGIWYFSKNPNPALAGWHVRQYAWHEHDNPIEWMLDVLYEHRIGILLVEGGPYVQTKCIESGLWDEAWVIRTLHELNHGIKAPIVRGHRIAELTSGTDIISGIENKRDTLERISPGLI